MTSSYRKDESGFTLTEILIAVAIIMIGLVAVMQSLPISTQGMDVGRRNSTGLFLAEQKIEQIKSWSLSATAPQGFATLAAGGTCFTDANGPCKNDAVNTIAGYPEYSRTVTVAAGPTATTWLVRVQVSYPQLTARGVATGTHVDVATLIAQR